MTVKMTQKLIAAAMGKSKVDLLLKNANVIDVFAERVTPTSIAISSGYIVGFGDYAAKEEWDLAGAYVCPGLIDSHIHLESSMLSPAEFSRAACACGTTAVVCDPHEIANVAGKDGIDYMLQATEDLPVDVYFTMPSCVPSSSLDEVVSPLNASDLCDYYAHPRVIGLAEIMNTHGVIHGESDLIKKIYDAHRKNKAIDGHAPGLSGRELYAYRLAGAASDHECTNAEEAFAKLSVGQMIIAREGTAAHNLKALAPLLRQPYCYRVMLGTDDAHPEMLVKHGHMTGVLARAIAVGADPIRAIRMATLQPAEYYSLKENGAVAPGYKADLMIFDSLAVPKANYVLKNGKLVAKDGVFLGKLPEEPAYCAEIEERVFHSFKGKEYTAADFALKQEGSHVRVLQLVPGELLTEERIAPLVENEGEARGVNTAEDIIKLAVCERHGASGRIGIGFLGGYGLKKGAVAITVAHDSHNLVVAGVTDEDMAVAANAVKEAGGGVAIAVEGEVLCVMPLPIAGLMCLDTAEQAYRKTVELKHTLHGLGCAESIDPLMNLSFVSLPVIPSLRVNTLGVIDVKHQTVVSPII